MRGPSPPPRVSIVVPTYNCAQYLPRALDSALAQSYRDHEVLIFDDGSTDQTGDVIEPYRDRVSYHRHANVGIGETRNRALALARGEFVAFLDADDCWDPDHLETKIRALDSIPAAAAAFGEFRVISPTDEVLAASGTEMQFPVLRRERLSVDCVFPHHCSLNVLGRDVPVRHGDIFNVLFLGNFILTSTLVMRRSAAAEIGGFTQMRTQEDYEFFLRLSSRHPLAYVPIAQVQYRRHPTQLTDFSRIESIVTAAAGIVDGYREHFARAGREELFKRRKAALCQTLASVQVRRGQPREARLTLSQAIRLQPTNWRAYALYLLSHVPHRMLAALKSIG